MVDMVGDDDRPEVTEESLKKKAKAQGAEKTPPPRRSTGVGKNMPHPMRSASHQT